MKRNNKWLTLLLVIAIFTACKKSTVPNEEAEIKPPTDINPTPESPACSHLAIEPVFGSTNTALFRYVSGSTYAAVIGSAGVTKHFN